MTRRSRLLLRGLGLGELLEERRERHLGEIPLLRRGKAQQCFGSLNAGNRPDPVQQCVGQVLVVTRANQHQEVVRTGYDVDALNLGQCRQVLDASPT